MTQSFDFGGLEATPGSYLAAARQIENDPSLDAKQINVAVVSTYTAAVIRPYLVVESARRDLAVVPTFGPYGQLEQQLLDPDSVIYASNPDVIVIATRIEDMAEDLSGRLATLSSSEVDEILGELDQRFGNLLESARKHSAGHILVFNFSPPRLTSMGLAGPMSEHPASSVVERANSIIAKACKNISSATVFEYGRVVLETGLDSWTDARLEHLGRIPFSFQAQMNLGKALSRYLSAIFFTPHKCLVVDLDNTLWGGVIGEDGLGGIALGEDYPGNVYKEFQRQLVALKDRGVLLAINSKNDEPDVTEVFERHPDMVLGLDDFAATRINWTDKASNIRSIAEELNIGVDALAFFDDNPVEREWIRANAPEVAVIEVPPDPENYAMALQDSEVFDHLVVVAEDLERAGVYQTEKRRTKLRATHASVADFIRDLDVKVTIGAVNDETMPRVVQLISKTNQFNLTGRRHTAAEIEEIVSLNGGIALWTRSTDRFGDNGLVGVAIAIPDSPTEWRIDSFLMSCRVLGRGVESALLSSLAQQVADKDGKQLIGEYVITKKNGMARAFFEGEGFNPRDEEGHYWEHALDGSSLPAPDFVTINTSET